MEAGAPNDKPEPPKKSRSAIAWVSSTYFAEGLPYMIVRIVSAVYFTDVGAKERYLGYLNFLGLPWNFKFLWAPFVDAISTKRRWLVGAQLLISILTAAIAATCLMIPSDAEAAPYLATIAVIFVGMAFIAATNDIAIDAHYLEGLTSKADQAAYSGYRVLAYRIAMVFARSGLVAVAAIAAEQIGGDNKHAHWAWAFGVGALTMFLITVFHAFKLPRFEQPRAAGDQATFARTTKTFYEAWRTYLLQEKVALILVFIIVYKLGDEILFSMVTPFLMREIGIDKAQYSWIGGIVGAAGSIIGAMVGGWWIKKSGLKRAIWPLTILMNFNIWAYVWLAWAKPDPSTLTGISTIAFVHGYEQIAAGLGSAALLVYLLRTCKPEYKAAHYAIGSAIMSLGSVFFGGFGGWVVEAVGYLNLFLIAFVASIPSMLLLFWVPLKEEEPAKVGA